MINVKDPVSSGLWTINLKSSTSNQYILGYSVSFELNWKYDIGMLSLINLVPQIAKSIRCNFLIKFRIPKIVHRIAFSEIVMGFWIATHSKQIGLRNVIRKLWEPKYLPLRNSHCHLFWAIILYRLPPIKVHILILPLF